MKEELNAELYGSWRNHPVTRALLEAMHERVEESKEHWLKGHFTDETSPEGTLLFQRAQQERARVYRELIEMDGNAFIEFIGVSE